MLLQDGLVSSWLFDNMRPGKTIGFKGVDGDFTLELTKGITHSRVLLVAGGIGITPMRVLLAERLALRQPVSLLYFVRSVSEAPFLDEFAEVGCQVASFCVHVALPCHAHEGSMLFAMEALTSVLNTLRMSVLWGGPCFTDAFTAAAVMVLAPSIPHPLMLAAGLLRAGLSTA